MLTGLRGAGVLIGSLEITLVGWLSIALYSPAAGLVAAGMTAFYPGLLPSVSSCWA